MPKFKKEEILYPEQRKKLVKEVKKLYDGGTKRIPKKYSGSDVLYYVFKSREFYCTGKYDVDNDTQYWVNNYDDVCTPKFYVGVINIITKEELIKPAAFLSLRGSTKEGFFFFRKKESYTAVRITGNEGRGVVGLDGIEIIPDVLDF